MRFFKCRPDDFKIIEMLLDIACQFRNDSYLSETDGNTRSVEAQSEYKKTCFFIVNRRNTLLGCFIEGFESSCVAIRIV